MWADNSKKLYNIVETYAFFFFFFGFVSSIDDASKELERGGNIVYNLHDSSDFFIKSMWADNSKKLYNIVETYPCENNLANPAII